jgi:LysR family cyn operon transcriptional activator
MMPSTSHNYQDLLFMDSIVVIYSLVMVVELRHLRYLLAVVEHGNFTRAAEELHVSQPTLSQQIKQLERGLGVQLLDRTGRTVLPTDAGQAYLQHARSALRDLASGERAVHDVQDLSRGHLRLAVTPTFTAYLVGPLAAELHAQYPGVALTVTEMAQEEIEPKLLADEIDLGIGFAGRHLPGIAAKTQFTETLSLVFGAHQSMPRRDRPLSSSELAQQELVLLSREFATRQQIEEYFARHRVSPRIVVEANSIQAVLEIVHWLPVATLLPDAITDAHPDLTPVPIEPSPPTRTVTLLRRDGAYESAVARAFTHILYASVRARGYASVTAAVDRDC